MRARGAAIRRRPRGNQPLVPRPKPANGRGLAGGAAVALGALALELAGPANRGGAFAGALLRRLLVMTPELHLAIDALTLQLLLERPQRLVDIVVANDDLHKGPSLSVEKHFPATLWAAIAETPIA